jgi:hypothetical protein
MSRLGLGVIELGYAVIRDAVLLANEVSQSGGKC